MFCRRSSPAEIQGSVRLPWTVSGPRVFSEEEEGAPGNPFPQPARRCGDHVDGAMAFKIRPRWRCPLFFRKFREVGRGSEEEEGGRKQRRRWEEERKGARVRFGLGELLVEGAKGVGEEGGGDRKSVV